MAAPAPVSYAAPMSYVPMPAPAAPVGPPASVLASMPDPATIAKQKDGYMKMLDDQLKQGTTVLDQQMKYQKDYLYAQADQQKKQYIMEVDQQVKTQEMGLSQQYNQQMMSLQQQAAQQKAALEQQAMQLTMEYQ